MRWKPLFQASFIWRGLKKVNAWNHNEDMLAKFLAKSFYIKNSKLISDTTDLFTKHRTPNLKCLGLDLDLDLDLD